MLECDRKKALRRSRKEEERGVLEFEAMETGFPLFAEETSGKLKGVHPSIKREKAWVKGSTWMPVFDVDNKLDARPISTKFTNFVMGIPVYFFHPTQLFDHIIL